MRSFPMRRRSSARGASSTRLDEILGHTPGVDDWFVLGGFSMLDGTVESNAATAFVIFKPWEERQERRREPGRDRGALESRVLQDCRRRSVFAMVPPPIRGLGVGGGFQMEVEDRERPGWPSCRIASQEIVDGGPPAARAGRRSIRHFARPCRSCFVDINRVKVKTTGVPLSDVFGTLEDMLGSAYVNDFNKFGRDVSGPRSGGQPISYAIRTISAGSKSGIATATMVPIGTLARVEKVRGPQVITRYNLFPARDDHRLLGSGL